MTMDGTDTHAVPLATVLVAKLTDAAVLKPAYGNPPTIILGPGEPQMAHQTDEYCIAERVLEFGELVLFGGEAEEESAKQGEGVMVNR